MKTFLNILVNSFKRKNFFLIFNKIKNKLEKDTSNEALNWINRNKIFSTEEFCRLIDFNLFEKISSELNQFENEAKQKLLKLDIALGGGGNYKLLYFLVRKYKLSCIVETGVAAGWSSLALLKAIRYNGFGKLYSSDLPYYRIKDSEKYIGILAKEEINTKNWYLDIRGDEIALFEIIKQLKHEMIDLFHYDSDKSYEGRAKSLRIVQKKLKVDTFIIFDDIQDNLHFKDYVEKNKKKFFIISNQDKYVGIIENKNLKSIYDSIL